MLPTKKNAYLYDDDIKNLADALQKNNYSKLKELNLFKNRITNEGFIALLNLLVGNTRVAQTCTHLNLGGNNIAGSTDISFENINQNLMFLDLHSNPIQKISNILNILKSLAGLTELKLGSINHEHQDNAVLIGVPTLSETNPHLEILELDSNRINDYGISFIAELINTHPNLRKLDLSDNKITDAGISQLAKLLNNNSKLIELNLIANPFTEESAELFRQEIKAKLPHLKLTLPLYHSEQRTENNITPRRI